MASQLWNELNAKGSFTINADGEDIVLEKDDVLIEMTQKEGFVQALTRVSQLLWILTLHQNLSRKAS